MRWLALTGVNGFIGHNLVLEFLEKQPQTSGLHVDRIVGADLPHTVERSTHGRNVEFSNYEFYPADSILATLEAKEKEFGSPPLAVIHNGACSATTETDPEVFRTLNVESSQELFRYCVKKGVPFLYASSASVYGDGSLGFEDSFEKNAQYSPLNLYGRSKHQFDSWVLEQTERPPTWFGLRYFNVFGPFERHKKGQASIFYWGRDQIEKTGGIKLFRSHRDEIEDGKQRRDFVSVFDVMRVTVGLLKLALTNPELDGNGRFVNVGRGEAATWLETSRALFRALDQPEQISFIDMPNALRQHYQNYTCAELSTLHNLGLTEPFLSLEDGFRKSLVRLGERVRS